jgi:hypothetical protein
VSVHPIVFSSRQGNPNPQQRTSRSTPRVRPFLLWIATLVTVLSVAYSAVPASASTLTSAAAQSHANWVAGYRFANPGERYGAICDAPGDAGRVSYYAYICIVWSYLVPTTSRDGRICAEYAEIWLPQSDSYAWTYKNSRYLCATVSKPHLASSFYWTYTGPMANVFGPGSGWHPFG